MLYFDGLTFGHYNYLPECPAWINRIFDNFALNFCRSGRILWGTDENDLGFLTGPVAWWTIPGPRYHYGAAPGETWEHFYTTFTGPRAETMLSTGLIPSNGAPQFRLISEPDTFAKTLFRLFETIERDGPESPRATLTLEDLFLQLREQTSPLESASPLERDIRAWLEDIRTTPEIPWSVPLQARRLAVSEVHLRRLVHTLIDMPPHRFIVERKLEWCAARLRGGHDPVKAVAAAAGFEDLPHFTRIFKRRYGISPAAYRRETQILGG